jgi:hypothetical protein
VRPMLNPALATLWRDEHTLQLGADPGRAVVLTGVTAQRAAFLGRLDGSLTSAEAVQAAASDGVPVAEAKKLLDLLLDRGALVDGASRHASLTELSAAERDRLAPDLAAWSLREPSAPQASARTFARRRQAVVGVHGAGRVGAALVGLLAAAGVGRIAVTDPRPVRGYDVAPGGAGPADVDQPRAQAALAAARTVAPALRSGLDGGRQPDLQLLCPDGPCAQPGRAAELGAQAVPHLVATTYEWVGVVGPFVFPGRTPCLRCLDLHRVDRDPQWPLVAAQAAQRGRPLAGSTVVAACDVVLATTVAAHAALAALAYLDEPSADSWLAGALLELRPPLAVPRRRSWDAHPACGCAWPPQPA